jgi:hypothetical protein
MQFFEYPAGYFECIGEYHYRFYICEDWVLRFNYNLKDQWDKD